MSNFSASDLGSSVGGTAPGTPRWAGRADCSAAPCCDQVSASPSPATAPDLLSTTSPLPPLSPLKGPSAALEAPFETQPGPTPATNVVTASLWCGPDFTASVCSSVASARFAERNKSRRAARTLPSLAPVHAPPSMTPSAPSATTTRGPSSPIDCSSSDRSMPTDVGSWAASWAVDPSTAEARSSARLSGSVRGARSAESSISRLAPSGCAISLTPSRWPAATSQPPPAPQASDDWVEPPDVRLTPHSSDVAIVLPSPARTHGSANGDKLECAAN